MYGETELAVILSKTELPLWGNVIPDIIYTIIMEKSEMQSVKEVQQLRRHNSVLVEAFCSIYGECLERCEFAMIRRLPFLFKHFYSIIQIPLFGNCMNPEVIEIHVHAVLSFYRITDEYREVEQFVRLNTKKCHSSLTFNGYIW